MGKKKRGANKAKSKKDRKQEIQARRERQLEAGRGGGGEQSQQQQLWNGDYDETVESEDVEILVGDRVFCRNYNLLKDPLLEEGDSYRGMIREIVTGTSEDDTVYVYVPINRKDEAENRIMLSRRDLIKDTYPLCPRFNTGDPVVVSKRDGWEPAIVKHVYPPDLYLKSEGMFPYRVRMVYDLELANDDSEFSSVPMDTDDFICERMDKFRFKVGDEALISTENGWVRGHIIDIDKMDGCYVCEYYASNNNGTSNNRRKRKKTHLVYKDNDEHIAPLESSSRQRLFDAIRQNCSYEHFVELISKNNLDVSSFKDLVLHEATKSACYGALLWLQEHANIVLSGFRRWWFAAPNC